MFELKEKKKKKKENTARLTVKSYVHKEPTCGQTLH